MKRGPTSSYDCCSRPHVGSFAIDILSCSVGDLSDRIEMEVLGGVQSRQD